MSELRCFHNPKLSNFEQTPIKSRRYTFVQTRDVKELTRPPRRPSASVVARLNGIRCATPYSLDGDVTHDQQDSTCGYFARFGAASRRTKEAGISKQTQSYLPVAAGLCMAVHRPPLGQ
jgi:hypothetical protein